MGFLFHQVPAGIKGVVYPGLNILRKVGEVISPIRHIFPKIFVGQERHCVIPVIQIGPGQPRRRILPHADYQHGRGQKNQQQQKQGFHRLTK